MQKRFFAIFLCTVMCLFLCSVSSCSNSVSTDVSTTSPISTNTLNINDQTTDALLIVSYIDIGQGDCILVEAPSGKTMLIDAGDTDQAQTVADYLTQKGIDTIDVLIATHPKQSHIGGMPYIVECFNIGCFYMPDTVLTNAAESLHQLKETIHDKGIQTITATAGLTIDLGNGLSVAMIAPIRADYTSSNDFSAVVKLVFGETSFLFTGDATEVSERDMLSADTDVSANVLKIGHHGESTSSCLEFLQAVSPEYAIISVGANNWYGHPEQATLDRLNALGIETYRTDQVGTIVVYSDGHSLEIFSQH